MPPDVPQLPAPDWLKTMKGPDQATPAPETAGDGMRVAPSIETPNEKRKRVSIDERMRAFVDNLFALNFNATAAVIASGYTKASARTTAARLLANVAVQAAIGERQRLLSDKTSELLKKVRERLECIAFGDMRALYHPDGRMKTPTEMSETEAAMVAGLTYEHKLGMAEDEFGARQVVTVETVKVKFHDPQKALDMLGRHTGLFSADGEAHRSPKVASKLVVNFVKPDQKGE